VSFVDIVLFDANYLDELQPDELLAVGAHEFTHINQRHGTKRLLRIYLPIVIIWIIVQWSVLNFLGIGLIALFSVPLSFIILLVVSFYVNAKWFRQQETECDLGAVELDYGEAMISALNKLNKLRPANEKSLLYRLMPKTYPRLEQRIYDIQAAMIHKKSRS
jgi:Zn-dependent protease with chaperone function